MIKELAKIRFENRPLLRGVAAYEGRSTVEMLVLLLVE